MTFSYDADSDVLYVALAPLSGNHRYVETKRGDILRFSAHTNELVGITIPFFEHRTGKGETIAIPDEALAIPQTAF